MIQVLTNSEENNSSNVKPYGKPNSSRKEEVADMFDNIAPKYDFLNHVLSFGIDKAWRRKAVTMFLNKPPENLLDIATGTADFAITATSMLPCKITGVDISEGMLKEGRKKILNLGLEDKIELLYGDSEQLPFPSD